MQLIIQTERASIENQTEHEIMQAAIKKIAACRGIGIEDGLLADPVWCREFLDTHAKYF